MLGISSFELIKQIRKGKYCDSNFRPPIRMPKPLFDGDDDFVRVGRLGEWLRVGVGFSDEPVDGRLEIDDGAEDTTFQSTSAELGEKSLDSVEPGARGWREVETKRG
jgi:hypothetical protein